MPKSIVDPSVLALLDQERVHTDTAKTNRVKLEDGDTWLIRFLPYAMGKDNTFYARIATHWLNLKPMICPHKTAEAFGGSEKNYCPVCEVADHLYDNAPNDDIRDLAFKAKAMPRWVIYCLVFEKESRNGKVEKMTGNEILKPCEFSLSRTLFDDLMVMIRRSAGRKGGTPLGVLDLERGYDVYVTRRKNNYRLDKAEEPGPIFELNDQFDVLVDKVWAQLRPPAVKIPSEEQLDEFAAKLSETADDLLGKRRKRRHQEEEEESLPVRRQSRSMDEGQSRRSNRTDEAREEEPVPETRQSRRPMAAVTQPEDEETAPATRSRASRQEPEDDVPYGGAEEPPRTSRPSQRSSAPPSMSSTRTAPPPPAAPQSRLSVDSSVDSEEENVPEESVDHAPPLSANGGAKEDAPQSSNLTTALRSRISRLKVNED